MNKLIGFIAITFLMSFNGIAIAKSAPMCPAVVKPKELPTPRSETRPSGATITVYDFSTLKVHAFTAPKPAMRTSTYVLEGARQLVIIEPQFMNSLAKDFRAYVDSLSKPIERIIVSDRDPDHYFGLASGFKDIPAYALSSVIATINKEGPKLVVERRKVFGPEMPDQQVAPSHALSTGRTTIDCIRYHFDSSTDDEGGQQITVNLPEYGIVFTGDIASNRCHLVPSKATEKRLADFVKHSKDYLLVLPSNGLPGNSQIFTDNLAYLKSVQQGLKEAKTAEEYQARMIKQYPDYDCDVYFHFYVPAYYQKK